MDDTPTMDELPGLIDRALEMCEERIRGGGVSLHGSIRAQLLYIREVVAGRRPDDPATDEKLLLDRYAAYEFETSDPPYSDVLAAVHYLFKRWSPPA